MAGLPPLLNAFYDDGHRCQGWINPAGDGIEPPPTFRLRGPNKWDLDPRFVPRLAQSGLLPLARMTSTGQSLMLDSSLLTALVDRWRPETHTFHFRWGEMTPTLKDVAMITGLLLRGPPVVPQPESLTWREDLEARFGIPLPRKEGGKDLRGVPKSWLSQFTVVPPDADDYVIRKHLIAYLLFLFGSIMFPSSSGDTIPPSYINMAVEIADNQFDDIIAYSWGSAVLCHTYRGLCVAVQRKPIRKEPVLSVCYILLQLWSWEHLPIGRPQIEHPVHPYKLGDTRFEPATFGSRWTYGKLRWARQFAGKCYPLYHDDLERLHDTEVIWDPFSQEDILYVGGAPGLSMQCTCDADIWMTRCNLVFAYMVEPYEPERVMRQFGLFQEVPPPLPRELAHDVHTQRNQGKSRHDWRHTNHTWIQNWSDASTNTVDEARAYDSQTYEAYMQWYSLSTRVRLTKAPRQRPTELTRDEQRERGMDRAVAGRRDDTIDRANSIIFDAQDIIRENPAIHHQLKTMLKRILDNAKGIVANWSCGRVDDVYLRAYHMPEVRSARPSEARSSRPSDVELACTTSTRHETGARLDSTLLRTAPRSRSPLQNVQLGLRPTREESPPHNTARETRAQSSCDRGQGSQIQMEFTPAAGDENWDHLDGSDARNLNLPIQRSMYAGQQHVLSQLFQGYSYGAQSSQAVDTSSYPLPQPTQPTDVDRDISRILIPQAPERSRETPERHLYPNPRAKSPLTYSADNCTRKKKKRRRKVQEAEAEPNDSATVYMVVMEDDPVVSYKASRKNIMRGEEAQKYKQIATTKHDIFLESFLPTGSYKKLYSYTHLLNGFALHAKSVETARILSGAKGVRLVQEDIKMAKMTTYTPKYIGASGVWPLLGGAENSGDGIVIGMIDTGIDPKNPSFAGFSDQAKPPPASFKGMCRSGDRFPPDSCNGKIVGARWFARAGQATGEFNATIHYASPYDPDGHGSHTASTAAGNFHTPAISRGYNFGYASGMAPGARLAIYKAAYPFGGYMSDVIAAVDQAVEDGVDVISLSMAPSSVSSGPASFLNLLETQLLLATKAGVSVVQAVGNGGPDASSIVSFSPWITSVAASTTDRKYNKSIITGHGQVFSCGAISPSTPGETMYPLALADDVSIANSTDGSNSCQDPKVFIRSLVQGKVIICMIVSSNYYEGGSLTNIIDTAQKIGAVGVVIADRYSGDVDIEYQPTFPTAIPSAIVVNGVDTMNLLEYYDNNTARGDDGGVMAFGASVRILEGRRASYSGEPPMVADYSSRGPNVENAQMQAADVLKPNVMAPGHHIWGAWSPTSDAMPEIQGESYAILSGTSMSTPHVAGVAALIRQRHPTWSPAMVMSAIMTTADVTDRSGRPLMARRDVGAVVAATPFDMGAGAINAARALDPGLVLDATYREYLQFLCAVPGVDEAAVRRATGALCPSARARWCSDLNTPSVTVASLVGSRRVDRRVWSVGAENETYMAYVRAPDGVAVRVSPDEFTIAPGGTAVLRIVLNTTAPGNAFSFGEVVLRGDKKHSVRIPLAVYPAAVLGP